MRLPFAFVVCLLLGLGLTACGGGTTSEEPDELFTLPNGDSLAQSKIDRYSELRADARKAYNDEDWGRCARLYSEALLIYPGNDYTHYAMASCLALDGQKERALGFVASAVDLGYWRPSVLEEDEDVDSIREDPYFQMTLERARKMESAHDATNPLEGEGDPAGPFDSLEALAAHYDELEPVGPLRRVLGSDESRQLNWTARRSHVRALEAFALAHPDQAAEASFEGLEVMTGFGHPGQWLNDEAESFLATYGDNPFSGKALLIQARADFEDEDLWDTDSERYPEALATMETVARQVVERYPDGAGSRDAYLWLMRAASSRYDQPALLTHYETLREKWGEDEEFWSNYAYEMTEPRLLTEGLPEFDVTSIDGEPLNLEVLRGKVTLLDFWATWCGPCIDELPSLKEVYAEHHEAGFEVIGFSADEESAKDLEEFRSWVDENEIPWPQFYDGTGWENEVQQAYGVAGIPTTVLLDREGKIAAVNLRGEKLVRKVEELL